MLRLNQCCLAACTALLVASTVVYVFTDAARAANDGNPKPVTVENTPNVNVTNIPPININNDSTDPIPVETIVPVRIPFQHEEKDLVSNVGSKILEFTIPETDRLVIEHVSARVVASSGSNIRDISLRTTENGATAPHWLVVGNSREDTGLGNIFVVGQDVRLYADPGSLVRLLVTVDPIASADVSAQMSVSGYLVPADHSRLAP